jgi:steroid 5-alpha reductase family enzyme
MKLPSSSLLVYGTTYVIVLVIGILLHSVSSSVIPSVLWRVYMIDLVLTCLLFLLGNFLFLSNNIYDLHWPLLPLICTIYFPWATHSLDHLSLKHLLITTLVCLWSFHLIWQTIFSSEDITHEDWRYQQMRQQYKDHFLLLAFFALHILPMIEVLLGSSALYYVYLHGSRDEQLTLPDTVLLALIFLGVLLENVADQQLKEFRQQKKRSRELRFAVLSTGLWKYSRHPNYLGELIFWWGLFFFGYNHSAPIWCALGPLFITLMMIFGSIPMSEERMFRKYPEYKFVQTDVPMLIPAFHFTE